jgi:hypothetical protein
MKLNKLKMEIFKEFLINPSVAIAK